MSTINSALEDKRYLGLDDFQTSQETALISNFMVYVTSPREIGKFTSAMIDFTSKTEKVQINHIEGPLNFSPDQQKKSTIKMISTFLFRNKKQIRPHHFETTPAHMLSVDDYNKHHKSLKKIQNKKNGRHKIHGLRQYP
jgi:hypothetical protein